MTDTTIDFYTKTQADTLLAAKADEVDLTAHTSRTDNPHAVTKTQVGLGSVDNTADTDKPVSTAQQTALDTKVAKAANLSDVASPATARTNLGLKDAATHAASDFATAAQGTKADAALPQAMVPVLATNLATQPIPVANDIAVVGAGYSSIYYGDDSNPSLVSAGGDGPIVNGSALAYRRKTIKNANVSGSRLVWVFTANNPDNTSIGVAANALVVTPNHTYRVTWWQRIMIAGSPAAVSQALTYSWFDNTGARIGSAVSTPSTPVVYGAWVRLSAALPTAPAGAVRLAIRESGMAPIVTIGDTSDVTGLMITDVTDNPARDEPYFDGSSLGCTWIGAPNNSASNRLLVRPVDDFDRKLGSRSSGQVPVVDLTQTSGWRFSTHLEFEGTGFPEGIVTAPVGSVYRDLAMTNGARQWIKASGTGNTGWRVFDGDTGLRDVTAQLSGLDPANTGTLKVQRVNERIYWYFSNLLLSAGTGSLTLWSAVPTGFRPATAGNNEQAWVMRTNSASQRQAIWLSGLTVAWLAEVQVATGVGTTQRPPVGISGNITIADPLAAWPTALPGIPG